MKSRESVSKNLVKRELLAEQNPRLLQELHLLTRHGSLNADARRKLKQVNHLVTLLANSLDDCMERFSNPVIVDVGSGKSYLGFVLYELFLGPRGKGHLTSIEFREELIEKSKNLAKEFQFDRMAFFKGVAADFKPAERPNLVLALHACDTATDDALALAIRNEADHIAVVPCCQAEVAELLKKEKNLKLGSLWNQGIHRREFGSHLTNVIRSLVLEKFGYQVTVTELVGWEHSLKNELILAKRVQRENGMAEGKLRSLLEEIKVRPALVRELLPDF